VAKKSIGSLKNLDLNKKNLIYVKIQFFYLKMSFMNFWQFSNFPGGACGTRKH